VLVVGGFGFLSEFGRICPIPDWFLNLKMAAEHSLESIALKMRGLKLEALAKGDLTDFSFLVGTEKSTAQVSFAIFGGLEVTNIRVFIFSSWFTASRAT